MIVKMNLPSIVISAVIFFFLTTTLVWGNSITKKRFHDQTLSSHIFDGVEALPLDVNNAKKGLFKRGIIPVKIPMTESTIVFNGFVVGKTQERQYVAVLKRFSNGSSLKRPSMIDVEMKPSLWVEAEVLFWEEESPVGLISVSNFSSSLLSVIPWNFSPPVEIKSLDKREAIAFSFNQTGPTEMTLKETDNLMVSIGTGGNLKVYPKGIYDQDQRKTAVDPSFFLHGAIIVDKATMSPLGLVNGLGSGHISGVPKHFEVFEFGPIYDFLLKSQEIVRKQQREEIRDGSVMIAWKNQDTLTNGIVVQESSTSYYIVTANKEPLSHDEIQVITRDGKIIRGSVQKKDSKNGLVLLSVGKSDQISLPIVRLSSKRKIEKTTSNQKGELFLQWPSNAKIEELSVLVEMTSNNGTDNLMNFNTGIQVDTNIQIPGAPIINKENNTVSGIFIETVNGNSVTFISSDQIYEFSKGTLAILAYKGANRGEVEVPDFSLSLPIVENLSPLLQSA